jgi:hypothetical protein
METVEVRCPYCGEINAIEIEWGIHATMIEDCWVCCRPIELEVGWDEWGDPRIRVRTEEG